MTFVDMKFFKSSLKVNFRFQNLRDFFQSKFEEKQVFLPLVFVFTIDSTCNWFYTEKPSSVLHIFMPLEKVCGGFG